MPDLSSLSDAELMRLHQGTAAPTGGDLSSLSDAELMKLYKPPQRPGVLATIDAGVRGAADMLTFGLADEAAAVGDTLIGKGPAGSSYGDFGARYDANLKAQRGVDAADEAEHPIARTAGQVGGAVLGTTGLVKAGLSPTAKAIEYGLPRAATIGIAGAEQGMQGAVYGFNSGKGGLADRVANMPANAAMGVVGGALGEAAAPLVQRGVQAVGNALTGRAATVAADDIANRMGTSFRNEAGQKGLVDAATGIPLTQGQAAQDFTRIAKEDAMRNDALGAGAGKIMRGFDQRQQQAIEQAAGKLTGGSPGKAMTVAGQTADDLAKASEAEWGKVSDAYGTAHALKAKQPAEPFVKLGSRIRSELSREGMDVATPLTPAANQAISVLNDIAPAIEGGKITAVSSQKLELARKKLMFFRKAAQANPADANAMGEIVRRFDTAWDDTLDGLQFSGSDEALNALKVARQARRAYSQKFEPQAKTDSAGKMIDTILESGNRSEREVADFLYGGVKTGESGAAVRAVDRVKTIFAEQPQVVERLQQGALDRILYEPEGKLFGKQRMVSRLEDYLDGQGREYAKSLHTPEQIQALRAFKEAMQKTIVPQGAGNVSGSAYAGSRIAQEATKKMMQAFGVVAGGPLGLTAVLAADQGSKMIGRAAARNATQGAFPIPKLTASPLFGAASARVGAAGGTMMLPGESQR